MLGNFKLFMLLLSSADFFQNLLFEKFFEEHYQSVKLFGYRSGQIVGPDLGLICKGH